MRNRTGESTGKDLLRIPSAWWKSWLALGWGIAFLIVFFSFDLPNGRPITRLEIWRLLPFHLLDLIDPPSGDKQGVRSSGWANISQRLDILLVAGVILAAAWAVGSLLLRAIRPLGIRNGVERTVIALALGLASLSLITLGFGLIGLLQRDVLSAVLSAAFAAECMLRFLDRRGKRTTAQNVNDPAPSPPDSRALRPSTADPRLKVACAIVMFPFLLAMLLGAMLPSVDFDVKEYHLQGPKEFYQNGRISFLPHNVYTSFPFLTEMLSLLGMVLRADWFSGALAGKAVLMSFAPLTAMALFAAGRRWFGETAGWLAATIYLTTPWIYRISIIAYAEGGLTFYLFLTLLTVGIAVENSRGQNGRRLFLIGGFLAGSAMACKYTGVLQVVFPIGVAVFSHALLRRGTDELRADRLRKSLGFLAVFTVGTCLAVGPWLLKNLAQTGNPVYPLVYSWFGGEDWDDELNAKWKAGHSPDDHRLTDLGEKCIDVTMKSDWQSPLLFALAPLALFAAGSRRQARWLWLYVLFLFFAWWTFTHRLDRFWVPMIPVVCLLAGRGAAWNESVIWKFGPAGLIASAVVFNLG
ncbi:MAG: glycosyltransferase family 39 protein, partial [Planctomycetes bacterium]|nr:glycosyltransferase family 39 protein [Planctomycetota bacterium]